MSELDAKEKGYASVCVVCGTMLKVERNFCFDHMDMEGTWEFNMDEEQDKRAKLNIEWRASEIKTPASKPIRTNVMKAKQRFLTDFRD
jgi:hypothetical protein